MCHTFVPHMARPINEKAADPFESAASAFLVVMGRNEITTKLGHLNSPSH